MAEIALETDLFSTFNSLSMGILALDKADNVELFNPAFLNIWKIPADKLAIGDPVKKFLETSAITIVEADDTEAVKTFSDDHSAKIAEGTDQPFIVECPDGTQLLCSITKLRDGGTLVSYLDVSANSFGIDASKNSQKSSNDSANAEQTDFERQIAEGIEALEDGFVLFDDEDRLVICNEAFREQFKDVPNLDSILIPGVTYLDMTSKLAHSGIIPGIEGKEKEFVEQLVQTRRSELGLSKTFKTHDGKWIRQRDVKTHSGGIVGTRIDVSEVKDNEERVKHTSDLLDSATKAMPQGLLVLDTEKVLYFNPRLLEVFDMDPEANEIFVGQPLEEFLENHVIRLNHEQPEEVKTRIRNRIAKGENYTLEHATQNGKTIRIQGVGQNSGIYLYTYTDISDEKAFQESLARREDLLNSILSASENGILVTNGFNEVVTYNYKAKDALGFGEDDEVYGFNYEELLGIQFDRKSYEGLEATGLDRDEFIAKAMRRSKAALKEAKTIHMADGKVLRYRIRELENGYLVHSYIDITREKKRETELEMARNDITGTMDRQVRIAEALAQGLIVFEDEEIVFFNSRAKELLELPDSILFEGQTLDGFLTMQAEAGHFAEMEADTDFMERNRKKISSGEPYQIDRTTKSGRQLRVDGVPDAATNSIIITFTDITNLKEREAELENAKAETEAAMFEVHKNQELFEAFANTNSDWFFRMDSELRFSYVSDAYTQVTGANPEKFLGKTRRETGIPGVDPVAFEAHLDDLENHRAFRDFTHPRTNTRGETVWFSISGNPIFDANGQFEGYVGSGRDVTENVRKQTELEAAKREAESAERAKSEFLANMSHEIRTPMNGVMGMAELLATTELDAKQKMFTDVIVKSGASLLTIINDILDFSKIDAGQLELDLAPFNMREAIEDVATLVSAKVAEKDLEMIVRIKPGLPNMVVGDAGRFRQIITNLLGNAVKFTEKGHIYVNIDGETDDNNQVHLKCSVEDTGIGIEPDKCEQIFSKFSQVDTSATRKHEGTGLGLSISSSLVSLMGGQLKVKSALGEGSTFWFEVSFDVHGEATNKASVIPSELANARVLIIDDNEVNRSILTEQMTAWKFDSAAAQNGEEGLAIIEAVLANSMDIDLVILDYQMPGMSGADVLAKMRSDQKMRDIPVIMLTSVDSSESNRRLSELGAEANLTKPTRSSLLLETIMQVIANNRASFKRFNGESENSETGNMADETPAELAAPTSETRTTPTVVDDAQLDVLVAEDNEVNQVVFRQILEDIGVSFQIVENGRLAVAAYKARKPKMILMDVSMPEMNGKEATQKIRSVEKQNGESRIPIVGVTAHALKGDMESCIDAGMDDYLSKPVSPQKLALKVQQWLKLNLDVEKTG